MKLILFSVLAATVCWAAKIEPSCDSGYIEYNPPPFFSGNDLIELYPDGYNGNTPVVFPTNYNCTYRINVPQGQYAEVVMTIITTGTTFSLPLVTVTDSLGRTENILSANKEFFYFMSTGGNITLATVMTNSSFAFSIHWRQYPSTFKPNSIQLNQSDTEPQVISYCHPNLTLVTAQSRVSALVIPTSTPEFSSLLRGIVFYDGPNWNSTYLGTAKQLSESGNQLVSSGNQLTIQTLFEQDCSDTHILLQEYENTKNLNNLKGVACSSLLSGDCQGVLDNSKGLSAFVTYLNGDFGYETVTSLSGNGTLDVYIGGVTANKKNLIASYPIDNSAIRLPQSFNGNARTYVLNGANARATINFTLLYTASEKSQMGRKGFIVSNHYTEKTLQWASAKISAPENTPTKFSIVIRTADVTKSSQFNITVSNGDSAAYGQSFSAYNLPAMNQVIQVVGDTLLVEFDSKDDLSNGIYIDFELLKASSNRISLFVTVLMCFFIIFH
ncbi:hypothetical protein GCK72_019763 [Caenorhabditis remanei]|uniref:Uncharacterized protein n=1 Tax=Caenorhabditis remanei TaxID=31234 RepID=A0A6A5GD85_CAERE|nr:hypothetical protein GCK72_019763 [Caenorhabditis remanei]KAF1753207.1 hypothetical protein GCK72_019763 [Caenorhabditis remanei]